MSRLSITIHIDGKIKTVSKGKKTTERITNNTTDMINETIRNRRTIRKYSDREVTDELIEGLLETSFRASTMENLQLYSVVITRNGEMKRRLADAHFNQPMVTEAPVVLTFCADMNRFDRWCRERDAQPGCDNLLSFVNGTIDALLVAQTFAALAEEQGLGLCYIGTTVYNPEKIIEILGLPRLVFPIATLTVGYPAETPKQQDRLPLRGLIHREKYSDYDRAAIDDIYAEKEALPESRHFMEINNKETLAQIYADIRYNKSDIEAISEKLIEVMRTQGFVK